MTGGEACMQLFGPTMQTLERSLDYASKQNQAISDNIANVDTPNYKAKEVVFKDVLGQTVKEMEGKRTHAKHIAFGSSASAYTTKTNHATTFNHNGNNVDIEKEMTASAKNQIYYQSMVDRLNGKFGTLQTVIRGGK